MKTRKEGKLPVIYLGIESIFLTIIKNEDEG